MNSNHRYPTRGVEPKSESLLHKRARIVAQPPAAKAGKIDYPEYPASQSKWPNKSDFAIDAHQLSDARQNKSKQI